MGRFIEYLQLKARQESEAALREVGYVLDKEMRKTARKQHEEEQILRERAKNRPQWEESRRQFNESKLQEILEEAIHLGGAVRIWTEPETFDSAFRDGEFGNRTGNPYFTAELHIEEIERKRDWKDKEYRLKYIFVKTDENGTMSFYGSRNLFDRLGERAIKVPKVKWKKNRKFLENALRKTYRSPRVTEWRTRSWLA